MDPIHTYDHAGCRIEIHYDDCEPESPLHYDGRLGVMMVSEHRRYQLGDEILDPDELKVVCRRCGGNGYWSSVRPDIDCYQCGGDGRIAVSLGEYLRQERGARVILPLGVYEHGGITMYVGGRHAFDSAGWDSGQVGVIFDTDETREGWGDDLTDDRIEAILRAEVKEYDYYLTGQVYGYVVRDPDGEDVDSCWGFIGEMEYAEKEGNAAAESHAEWMARESVERQEMAARDIVTVAA